MNGTVAGRSSDYCAASAGTCIRSISSSMRGQCVASVTWRRLRPMSERPGYGFGMRPPLDLLKAGQRDEVIQAAERDFV
jgi:hypothetical protein